MWYHSTETKYIKIGNKIINLSRVESIDEGHKIHYISGRTETITKEEHDALDKLLFRKDLDNE